MEYRPFIEKLLVLGVLLSVGTQVFGQTNAIATGNWSDPLTWSSGEPSGTQSAVINGGFEVTIDQSGEATNLLDVGTVSGQTGNLKLTGGDLFVSDVDTVAAPNLPSIRIGQAAGSTGNFTMSDGIVFVDKFDYDPAPGEQFEFANGDLIVGDVGTGTMTMTGGDFQASDEIIIGLAAGATGTATVSNANLQTNGRSILVGFGGNGTLNVSGTATVKANFDLLVGFLPGSTATINQSGGSIEAGLMFSNFDIPAAPTAGSTVNWMMSGGTFTTRIAYVMGRGTGTTTLTHSGGEINCTQGNGDFVVSDGNANTSTYNISGTALVNASHDFIVGAFNGASGTINQSGGTINTARAYRIGADGVGQWNLSGGTLAGGSVFLGDFDDSFGTLKITGGNVALTGSLNVGGALASNADPLRVEPDGTNGPQGQALGAHGTLIVSGNGSTINVGGNFLANPNDKSSFRRAPFAPGGDNTSDLIFEFFNSSGTSLINTTGVADLDGAVVDIDLMSGFTPAVNATFDLLKASSFGSTGTGTTQSVGTGLGFSLAAEDAGVFSLAVVSSGGGQVLRATFLGVAGVQGDYNNNGVVDSADYVLWRNGGPLQNDPTAGVTAGDYDFWRSRFGANSGSGAGSSAAVPELGTWLLLVVGAALGWHRSKRS